MGAVGALVMVLSLLFAASALAHKSDQLEEYGTAQINGVIGNNEYDDGCTGPNSQTAGAITYQITVCEQNDEANDYYAIKVSDLTSNPGSQDYVHLWFDNDHSGTVQASGPSCTYGQPNEDNIGWFFDFFWDGLYCIDAGTWTGGLDFALDGNGTSKFTAGQGWVFELSHPLDSGDPDDYSLAQHDEVGWCLTYDDTNNSLPNNPGFAFGEIQYPQGCFVDFSNMTKGLVRGDASNLADVRKLTALDEALEGLKEKLKGLVATCKFCPPDPRKKLLDKVNEAIQALSKGQKLAAKNALKEFKALTKSFLKADDLPEGKGKRFLKLSGKTLLIVKKHKKTKSVATTPIAGGQHVNQVRVPANGGTR